MPTINVPLTMWKSAEMAQTAAERHAAALSEKNKTKTGHSRESG